MRFVTPYNCCAAGIRLRQRLRRDRQPLPYRGKRPIMRLVTPRDAACLQLAALAALLTLGSTASAVEPAGNAFAGRETVVVRDISGLNPGEAVWFRVTKDHRTLASGTVRTEADNIIRLPVALPEIKPGVALPLTVTLRAGSKQGLPLRTDSTLWALSEQPLPSGRNPAAPHDIWLYDPAGRTEAAFRSIAIPFTAAIRLEPLAAMTNITLVVGEGLSLDAERGLWEALMTSVARGNRVLLLAPTEGRLRLPAAWTQLTAGTAGENLRAPLRGGSTYKLDLKRWPPHGAIRSRFQLIGVRDQAVFDVTPEAGCEAVHWTDAASGGSFTACGLGVIACWETAPAARWLLVEMLNKEK